MAALHQPPLGSVNATKYEAWLFWIATLAVAAIPVSIAASQVLLGVGILAFLLLHQKLYFPRIWVPLAAFFLWTALADVVSPDPWGGRAQIKKFFVFLLLPLVYGVFRQQFSRIRLVVQAWLLTSTVSGLWSLIQFVLKYQHARKTGEDFYVTYVGHRITGFESHWMTFGALQLGALSVLLAFFLFARKSLPIWLYAALPIFLVSIVLGETRSIWIATVPAVLYLLGSWKPRAMLLVPVVIALAYFASPTTTKERFQSLVVPHGDTDSNRHRIYTFRTGVAMVKAHPIFGIGPEQISRQFDSYLPPDLSRPKPTGYYGHLHNIYLQYAAERGIPAVLILAWFLSWVVIDCARALPRSGNLEQAIIRATLAVILGILVGGLFEYNLGDSEVLMMFVSVIGFAYASIANVSASTNTNSKAD